MSIKLDSNAKINLALSINYKRSDEMHDISTIMQEIDLHDTIELSTNETNQINIVSKGIQVPEDQTNLCYIAANLFLLENKINKGVDIVIHKNIPVGGGLGGGSSNASSVIKGLFKLFDISSNSKIFYKISSNIGADVSFFYNGGMQYATGIGDQLMPLPPLLDQYYFLLIFPKFSISTPWAYKEYKNYLENQSNESNFVPLSDKVDFSLWRNDFEKVVLSTYPEIKQMKNDLQNSQSLFAALSGSGSTMFGVYDNLEFVANARNKFKDFQTSIALPVN